MLFIPYAGDIDPSLELIHLHHGIHIHGRSLFDLHKTDNDSLDDTFGHCTACGNGNRQKAKPQQFLRPGKREGRFGLQLILEVDFRKLCKYCFTGTDNQPESDAVIPLML